MSLTRPECFNYQPGDYIFLKVPAIAKYEWHPFTISSSPEQQDFIGLHIRSVGTWTSKLYDFVEERNLNLKNDVESACKNVQLNLSRINSVTYMKMIESGFKQDDVTIEGHCRTKHLSNHKVQVRK